MIKIDEEGKSARLHEHNEILKCEKRTLHSRYIAGICISLCVWSIVFHTYSEPGFVEQLGMASTVTSIILSVIAIILSITGEGKTEGIRNQMMETTQELRETVSKVQKINDGVDESLQGLKKGLNELQIKIDALPDNTVQMLFTKSNQNRSKVNTETIKDNWGSVNK